MHEQLLALAYELAASNIHTRRIMGHLRSSEYSVQFDYDTRTAIAAKVAELRKGEYEFGVGDRVTFYHWPSDSRMIGRVVYVEERARRARILTVETTSSQFPTIRVNEEEGGCRLVTD